MYKPIIASLTEDLEVTSDQFKVKSSRLKKKYWWKNTKMKLLIAAIVFVVLLVIVLVIVCKCSRCSVPLCVSGHAVQCHCV